MLWLLKPYLIPRKVWKNWLKRNPIRHTKHKEGTDSSGVTEMKNFCGWKEWVGNDDRSIYLRRKSWGSWACLDRERVGENLSTQASEGRGSRGWRQVLLSGARLLGQEIRQKLIHWKFHLNVRKNETDCPGKVWSLIWRNSKAAWTQSWVPCSWGTCLSREVGLDSLQWLLPT